MTPLRARLALLAVMAIFLATAGNALFLQDRARLRQNTAMPSTAVSVSQFSQDRQATTAPAAASRAQQPSAPSPKDRETRLQTALYRELGQRGYGSELQFGNNGLRLAVLAYEYDSGLALTGEPTDALLKRLLFDQNQAPRGTFADRAEANPKLVMQTQKALLELGFFRGTLSGRVDIWTANAIKDFERHRNIAITGRLTEATLLELISYSGQPILASRD